MPKKHMHDTSLSKKPIHIMKTFETKAELAIKTAQQANTCIELFNKYQNLIDSSKERDGVERGLDVLRTNGVTLIRNELGLIVSVRVDGTLHLV